MTTATIARPTMETVADLVKRLGDIPLERIRLHPPPGTATEADVLVSPDGADRLCELVDGVLVEKPMGYYESCLALILGHLLLQYLDQHDLGIVVGESGPLRLAVGRVRMPDVCFISWERFSDRKLPRSGILDRAPDLAVEVISPGNTETEMEQKLQEYFAAGACLVWYVYPETRSVRIYTSPTDVRVACEEESLDGGDVLPGFRLSIRDWFDRAGEREANGGPAGSPA
jgi:Uma2 family endonuclease